MNGYVGIRDISIKEYTTGHVAKGAFIINMLYYIVLS